MKCPWFNNTDFVDDITDISFIFPEYYPKWNTDNILEWYINNNEYLTGKKENKNMNHKIKNAKNDKVKNMLDKWISCGCTKTMTPKMIKHNGPATIVFWADGTKTVVKANPDLIEEKRVCYLDESGKRHYKTVTIDRTDDSAAVMYAYVKKWICDNNDRKFHRFLKVIESREEK